MSSTSGVIGLPHEDFGEAVTAIVVKDDASMLREVDIISPITGDKAVRHCAKRTECKTAS